jgi:undecaprenyl-diphosphatase
MAGVRASGAGAMEIAACGLGASRLDKIDRIDRAGVEALSGLHWPVLTPIMKFVSYTGVHQVVFLLVAVGVAFKLRRVSPVAMTVVAMFAAGQLDGFLKALIGRPRPPIGDHNVHALIPLPADPSMPSGHALTSFTCAVVLGHFAPRLRLPLLVFAGVVSFSRPYLGVHYPSDVIVGAFLGVALGLALNAAFGIGCRYRAARSSRTADPIAVRP